MTQISVSIVRNFTHHSSISLLYCDYGSTKFYRKVSFSEEGRMCINREYSGYKWYEKSYRCDYLSSPLRFLDNDVFSLLDIPLIDMSPPNLNLKISQLQRYIDLAILHYHSVWTDKLHSLSSNFPLHGDFSLAGNILFDNDNIFVIDWEHFHDSCAPLGFDILFMLFELLIIKFKSSLPDINSLYTVARSISYAKNLGVIDPIFLNYSTPLRSFLDCQSSLSTYWGDQYTKLPTCGYSKAHIRHIDRLLSSYL